MQRLTIVLLCTGPGSDPSIFRPSRDDVRYRHRHDALVRCVAAALYGGAGSAHNRGDGSPAVELILLYDGDLACMRMTISSFHARRGGASSVPPPPLEKDVVAMWRTAAKEAVRSRQNALELNGTSSRLGTVGKLAPISARKNFGTVDAPRLNATCVLDTWESVDSSKSSSLSMSNSDPGSMATRNADAQGTKKLPSYMPSSKRETVSILQSTCPVDYLREHRLNVPIDVALRKFNRGKLQAIWEGYEGKRNNHEAGHAGGDGKRKRYATGDNGAGDDQWDKMERTFRSLLAEANGCGSTKDDSTNVIASYLHESCDAELPCWGWDGIKEGSTSDGASRHQHIFLFLGAVRDMTASENDALARACAKLQIPLVPCRLGPVPEFTSKIVSVAAYHFGRGVLGKGLVELWKRPKSKQDTAAADAIVADSPLPLQKAKRTLHTIAIVPMDSHLLSYDPSQRNRVMWCMVRLCVCSLWRSKLASGSSGSSGEILNNNLTFVFRDGVQMTLEQEEFIAALAEKHRAAPSERQILEELCHRRDIGAPTVTNGGTDIKRVCHEIVSSLGPISSDDDEAFALDFTRLREAETATSPPLNPMDMSCSHEKEMPRSVMDLAYSKSHDQIEHMQTSNDASNMTLFAILRIRTDLMETSDKISEEKVGKIHRSLRRAMSKAGVSVQDQMPLLDNSCQDVEACTVIMLQHSDYQGRLFQTLRRMADDDDAIKDDDADGNRKRKKKKKKQKDKGKKRRTMVRV